MKLKVQQLMDATLVVSQIIREKRPLPQKGSYWVARLHTKLLPEFNTASARRDEMITAYDHKETVKGAEGEPDVVADQFSVPLDKMPEFNAAWKEIADEEIEVDVQPIPLGYLDLGESVQGSIAASELVTLGDLVRE